MKKINIQVKEDFDYFNELTFGSKLLKENPILLVQKINHKDWLSKTINVIHSNVDDNIELLVEKKKSLYKYGFKLICKNFLDEPFFRFDSDGPAHRNAIENIPLNEQRVTTPHFNSFDNNGYYFAYKSDVLKDDGNAQAIVNNLEFGFDHFCKETNINQREKDVIPKVEISNPELFEDNLESDPLNGIDFIT